MRHSRPVTLAATAPSRDAERQQEDFELTDQSHDANCVLEPLKR